MIKKIEKLVKKINKKKQTTEARTVTLDGVKNLSKSDLDLMLMYCERYMRTGSINGLMKLYGEKAEVFIKNGIVFD